MRTPVVKRHTFPCERIFALFFRWAAGQASSVSSNVFRLHFRGLVHSCDCTKHFLRVERHRDGGYREQA